MGNYPIIITKKTLNISVDVDKGIQEFKGNVWQLRSELSECF